MLRMTSFNTCAQSLASCSLGCEHWDAQSTQASFGDSFGLSSEEQVCPLGLALVFGRAYQADRAEGWTERGFTAAPGLVPAPALMRDVPGLGLASRKDDLETKM